VWRRPERTEQRIVGLLREGRGNSALRKANIISVVREAGAAAAATTAADADHGAGSASIDIPKLLRALKPFRIADDKRGMMELVVTVGPLVILWIATMLLVRAGMWVGLLLAIPAGAFLLRLFIIQHDCGHGSFFRKKIANLWVGRVIGVLTLTPYEFWRRSHAQHHARTGNLDRRGLGDVDTLTLTEYRALTPVARWRYRVYRHPLVLFGLGPAVQFLVRHRLPFGITTGGLRPWVSVATTNAAIAIFCIAVAWYFGIAAFLMVHLPITLIAATLGVWLFYIQHQFEHTVWEDGRDWSFAEAALYGSSHYELPAVLRWFSANIGVHHVHHLCSTIPSYRMQSVLREFPELRGVSRLSLRQSLGATRLALWDERSRRLISFKEARAA